MTVSVGLSACCARRNNVSPSSRVVCNCSRTRAYRHRPSKDREQRWRLTHLLTQGTCLGVGALYLGRSGPFGHRQGRAEGNGQGQGLLRMLRRLCQALQEVDPSGAVADGFHVGRAVAGLLARPRPVMHRRRGAACRRVVLGDQGRLHFHACGKPGCYHLRTLLVHLRPGALAQRLLGSLLHPRRLEAIRRVGHAPPLGEPCRLPCHRLESHRGKFPANGRPQWRHPFGWPQSVEPGPERSVQGRRHGERRQGRHERLAPLPLLHQPGLEHPRGPLFHKPRHPIGGGPQVCRHPPRAGVCGRSAAPPWLLRAGGASGAGPVGADAPRQARARPTRGDPPATPAGGRSGPLVQQEGQPCQRRGIGPVAICDDHTHWLPLRRGAQPGQHRDARLRPRQRGRRRPRRGGRGQRQPQERRPPGPLLVRRQATPCEHPGHLGQLCGGRVLRAHVPGLLAAQAPGEKRPGARRRAHSDTPGAEAPSQRVGQGPSAPGATCQCPASPRSPTPCPSPLVACAQASCRRPTSGSRPTNGVRPGERVPAKRCCGARARSTWETPSGSAPASGRCVPSAAQTTSPWTSWQVAWLHGASSRWRAVAQGGGQGLGVAQRPGRAPGAACHSAHHLPPRRPPHLHGQHKAPSRAAPAEQAWPPPRRGPGRRAPHAGSHLPAPAGSQNTRPGSARGPGGSGPPNRCTTSVQRWR